jgi:hypothetical protein
MELGEKWLVNFACDSNFHVNRRGLFTCRKSATWGRRLYFPTKGRHAVDFLPEKSDGFSQVQTRDLGYQRPAC